uniref:Uncharacterized protein n=1 Tax=Quercus lobata TaxID=97700 RepID=A0A7N2MUB6_QUELO
MGAKVPWATGNSVVTVGYVMKPSHEEDFAKRGAFPLFPTQNGLIFMPLPLSSLYHLNYKRYLEDHPDCCVIDSFNNIYPVLDRLEIQEILLRLEDLKTEGRSTIRGPHFLKELCLDGFLVRIDSFKEPDLLRRLSES